MSSTIERMLAPYQSATTQDRKNAMKEVVQEIALCGLSRAGFFKHAAFYGGTALRIFHGLDRFSEDLDFSLAAPDPAFDLAEFLPVLENEVRSFGLDLSIKKKEKSADSPIQSVFLKGGTLQHLLVFYPRDTSKGDAAHDEKLKIKLEIDTDPAPFARFERKYRLLPTPYEARIYDKPSLFAGKLHAVICRRWKHRVKGRDLYDLVFYLSERTPVNLEHLAAKLAQSGMVGKDEPFDLRRLNDMLCNRFDTIDFENAKQDVDPFLKDPNVLSLWSAEFFKQICEGIEASER